MEFSEEITINLLKVRCVLRENPDYSQDCSDRETRLQLEIDEAKV